MNEARLQNLLEAFQDNALSEDECRELLEWFDGDESRLAEFADELRIGNALAVLHLADSDVIPSSVRDSLSQSALAGDVSQKVRREIENRSRRSAGTDVAAVARPRTDRHPPSGDGSYVSGGGASSWAPIAVVASVLAVLSLVGYGVYRSDNTAEPNRPIATITDLIDVQWADTRASLSLGDKVSPRRMSLTEGTVCFTFAHRVALTVEAPADFELLDRDHVTLHAGQLVAFVPDGAEGFTVLTESAEVVDLGTEFGVATSNDGTSEVIVFDGEVELSARAASETKPTRVFAGTAFRVDHETGPHLREFQPDLYEEARTALRQRKVIRYSFRSDRFFPGKRNNGWTGPWNINSANLNIDKSQTGITSDRPLFNGTLNYLKVAGAAGTETDPSQLALSRGFASFERFDATQPFSIEFCVRVDGEPSDIQDIQFSVEHAATGNVSHIHTLRDQNEQPLSWPTEGTADPVTITQGTAYRFLIHIDPQGGRRRATVSDGKRSTRLRLTSDSSTTSSQADSSSEHLLSWDFTVHPGSDMQFSLDAIRIQNAPAPEANSTAIHE